MLKHKLRMIPTVLAAWGCVWCRENARTDSSQSQEIWNCHFQSTIVSQFHPGFTSSYSGAKSLVSHEEWKNSLTSTLFLGTRLWRGGQAYFNPELSGGSGLSHAQGVAGFPNGEIYRVSSPDPKLGLARLYVQQIFCLGQGPEKIESDQNQLAGILARSRITLTLGKFSLNDFFDDNTYSHDPRTQFLNWSLMDFGAWDYAADTKGYTYGAVMEATRWGWALRLASVMVPKEANGPDMDPKILHAHGNNLEIEKDYAFSSRPGRVRVLAYANNAHMGNYRETLNSPKDSLDVARSRRYALKFGFGVNAEQSVSNNIGLFMRTSWNDGRTETWAFTEIDRSLTFGLDAKGGAWNRKPDHFGAALIWNGLSQDHADYLASGGYGFIIGDGALTYGPEFVTELYYLYKPLRFLGLSLDYQEVVHPGYNQDRGPVSVFAGRLHLEI